MGTIEPRAPRKGQQFLSRVLRAAAARTQRAIGETLGWSESRTSRVLSGEASVTLEEALELVAACDLAVIDAPAGETLTVSAAHYRALTTLAAERMDALQQERV